MFNLLLLTLIVVIVIYGVSSGIISSPWGILIGIIIAIFLLFK